jgi:hypothetical protein
MTPETILDSIKGIRANLHALILLAATLTQQISAARESLKQTEDNIIAEIWADEQFKNDRQRNEQKRLARINDERYLAAADRVQTLEMERAQCNADILVVQNDLTIATTQYQQACISDYLGGLRFQMQMVQVHSADQTSMEVKPQIALQDPVADPAATGVAATSQPTPVEAIGEVPELAAIYQEAKAAEAADDPAQAPYLKQGDGKKPEKVGGVRI